MGVSLGIIMCLIKLVLINYYWMRGLKVCVCDFVVVDYLVLYDFLMDS